jgi:cation diffusion facilitator family transporter
LEEKAALNTSLWSIGLNFCLAIVKGLVGYFGHSYALIADAIESTSDIFSSFVVYLGLRISTKPADANHPYGHGKAEPLTTFLVCGFLVVSAVIISVQSINHILTPHKTPAAYTLYVLIIVIVIKEITFRLIRKKGEELHSTALGAEAWHHRSDALTSLAALIGIAIAIFGGPGYEVADDWAALLTAVVIVTNAYLLFRPALSEIMDEHKYEELESQIRSLSQAVPGVRDTEKCYVRKMGMRYYVELHVIVDGNISVREGHQIAHQLKDHLREHVPQIADVLIHVEPDD